jgi:transposase InsO family protein
VPPKEPLRVYSKARADALDDLVEKGLKSGVFIEGISQASSPPHVFPKPNEPAVHRMTVDFRKLNAGVVPVNYPMPNLEKSLEALGGYRLYSKMDLREGYHQIPIRQSDRWKTGFITRKGAFMYTRIPMGLTTAPNYFQSCMASLLRGLEGVVGFVDDVIVAANSKAEMLSRLREVLMRLKDADLKLKREKCVFGVTTVKYLGFQLDGNGVQIDDNRRQALREIKPPGTSKQLRAFLGLANFFRRMTKGFAQTAEPLYQMLRSSEGKAAAYPLQGAQLTAFEELKKAIVESPVCRHVDYRKPLYLRTDASNSGIGAMLYQMQEAPPAAQPVVFLSRTFRGAEERWTTAEKEAYAVFWAVQKLESHLLGHPFVVETDNKTITYMANSKTPKIIRWRLKLDEFDFQIRHISGKDNVVADGLSRCLAVGSAAGDTVRQRLLEGEHNAVSGHHTAATMVQRLVAKGLTWPEMEEDAAKVAASCAVCQKIAPVTQKDRLHGPTYASAAQGVFTDVQFDHIGPLTTDADGHRHILVFICQLSRFVVLYPTKTKDAEETAQCLLSLASAYRVPERINSDRGGAFVSEVLASYVRLMGIHHVLHTPYHHQESGMVERANRSVLKHLRALVLEARVKDQWGMFLPLVQRVVNTSVHRVTGLAPVQLVFSAALLDGGVPETLASKAAPQSERETQLVEIERALLRAARQNQADFVSAKDGTEPVAKLPTWVLVHQDKGPKLQPRWRGPCKVATAVNEKGVVVGVSVVDDAIGYVMIGI